MLGKLLSGFIVILIGVNLMPVIADAIATARTPNATSGVTNLSGATITIVNLVILFYALGIMAAGVVLALEGLRDAELI